MPPRFAYWTILIDGKATAFRARDQEELLPTLAQLKRKNADVALKWFAQGKLWDSQEAQRSAGRPAFSGEKRGGDWRPGGAHKDPRDRFKKKNRPERAWSEKDPATQRDRDKLAGPPRGDRFKPAGGGEKRPWSPKPSGPPRERRPWSNRPPAAPPSDRPWQTKPTGPRAQRKPWTGKPSGSAPSGDRPWRDKPAGPPRGDRPWSSKPPSGEKRPWSGKPSGPPRGDRPWSNKPPTGDRRPWSGKPRSDKPGGFAAGGPPRERKPWTDKPAGGPPRGDRPWSKPPSGERRPWSGKPSSGEKRPWSPKPGGSTEPRKRRDDEPPDRG